MDMDNPFFRSRPSNFEEIPFYWSRPSVRPTNFEGISAYSPQPQAQHRKQPAKKPSTTPKRDQIPVHFVGSEPLRSASPFTFREPQVQHREQPVNNTSSTTPPKVVRIPVHFMGSEPSRSASALKIQKVFRGFLVRRSVKRIIAISREVEEIERRISSSETLDLIRRDERERLRLNEMLMSLLFKLDSVQGVDSGVRDCRRAVIKKAIALQERVDAIVSDGDQIEIQILGELKDKDQQNAEAVAQDLESTGSAAQNSVEYGIQIEESAVVNLDHGPQESSEGKDAGQGELLKGVPESDDPVADHWEGAEVGGDLKVNGEEESCGEETTDGNCEVKQFGVHSEMQVEEENCIEDEVVDNLVEVKADRGTRVKEEERCIEKEIEESCHKTPTVSEWLQESMEASQMETLTEGGEVNDVSMKRVEEMGGEEKEGTDDKKGNQELLERMMKDNGKMMNLMTQLCERNEMQTRMLNALTHRVEQLEKAFVCHRLRRKKGRHSA